MRAAAFAIVLLFAPLAHAAWAVTVRNEVTKEVKHYELDPELFNIPGTPGSPWLCSVGAVELIHERGHKNEIRILRCSLAGGATAAVSAWSALGGSDGVLTLSDLSPGGGIRVRLAWEP